MLSQRRRAMCLDSADHQRVLKQLDTFLIWHIDIFDKRTQCSGGRENLNVPVRLHLALRDVARFDLPQCRSFQLSEWHLAFWCRPSVYSQAAALVVVFVRGQMGRSMPSPPQTLLRPRAAA